jgi:hypothetical protein
MTTIQHNSLLNTSTKALKGSPHNIDCNDSFESVFEAVDVKKEPKVEGSPPIDDVNSEQLSLLDSEIRIRQREVLKTFDGVQDDPVSKESLKKEDNKESSILMADNLVCKNSSKNDGAELDISMLIPFIAPEVKVSTLDISMLIPFIAPEIKVSTPGANDASQVLDAPTISTVRGYPEAFERVMHIDANELENFDVSASSVISSDEIALPPAAYDIKLAQGDRSIGSGMNTMSKVDPFDAFGDEVSIVSEDTVSKIPEVKLENNSSMQGESAEDLNDPAAAELDIEGATKEFDVNIKIDQSVTAVTISDKADGIKELSSGPSQQIYQAIQTGKEGISPKEPKTLSIVLNPEELGVVSVELTSDLAGKISAVLSVEKQETLNLLQQDFHHLKSILKEIGIDDSGVSLQLSSNADQGHQQHSEYVNWDERERMLTRNQNTEDQQINANVPVEKTMYNGRSTTRRLDIQA